MTLGVVGAGTMGAGIAQLGCVAGERTLLHDPAPGTLDRALEQIPQQLAKGAERGRWASGLEGHLERADTLDAFADCDIVIEAAPEDLDLKQSLFTELAGIVRGDCVLATNTSSLLVTAIAAGVPGPERVVGLHFFNPAPLMRLAELVAGQETNAASVDRARALGEAMGKRVILAADGPGFIVNRCNRPFGLEALRCLQERMADVETIDRIARLGGGFRMGPFELMDLVGVDVGFEVAKSFFEQSFGEPRWRPSMLQARMAASGRAGRKAGRGWYEYPEGAEHRPPDPEPPDPSPPARDEGLVVIGGESALAEELRGAATLAGWEALDPIDAAGQVPWLTIDCGTGDEDPPLEGGPHLMLCDRGSLAALDADGPSAGFHCLPPLDGCRLVELTRGPNTTPLAAARAERFFATLGKHTAWVGDAPGLVLGRIVAQLVNEAAFALGEGVGTAEDIDAGMVLGLNHPRGPLEWSGLIEVEHVALILEGLYAETREERYRMAPALHRALALGRPLR